jgi:hypothetical protein
MIRINCTNCKAQLSIDEAFAGGVCRCQYCGTIQTVPKHLKADAAAPVPSGKPAGNGDSSSKVVHKKKPRIAGADLGLSSGLDAIADAVASSGLSGSGLSSNYGLGRREPLVEPSAPSPAANNKLLPLLIGSGVLIVLLVGVVIGLLMKGNSGSGGMPDGGTGSGNEPTVPTPAISPADGRVTGPAMLGLPLNESSIIFLLDHGSAMRGDTFDFEKLATLKAIESLRPEQRFQVIFWKVDRDKDPVTYPKTLIPASNREEIKKCAAAMDEVVTYGASEAKPALEKAFAAKPAAIVLATAKQMDETLLKAVIDARKSNTTRVHCLSLGEKGNNKVMQDIASKTGGIFKLVKPEELQALSR